MPLEVLISHMKIEEANRLKDKKNYVSSVCVKASLVESSTTSEYKYEAKGKKFKKSRHQKNSKGDNGKNKKFKVMDCFECGKPGHKSYPC